jgi:hypothetical protein
VVLILRKIPRWLFERRERRHQGAMAGPEQFLATQNKGEKRRTLMIER